MAGLMLETPSRVLRRIQAAEANDMSSLPSLPAFEDSGILSSSHHSSHSNLQHSDSIHKSDESDPIDGSLPFQSTPTTYLSHHTTTTARPPPNSSSTVRFANSIAVSRSSKSASSHSQSQSRFGVSPSTRQSRHDSFDVSEIRPVVHDSGSSDDEYGGAISVELAHSRESAPNGYLSGAPLLSEEELDLSDALEDINPNNSPFHANELGNDPSPPRAGKYYDYSASLRHEPKVSGDLRYIV